VVKVKNVRSGIVIIADTGLKLGPGEVAEISRLTLADMPDTDPAHYGLAASPTRVVKVYENVIQTKVEALRLSPQEAAALLCGELKEAQHE
jgi:hypothetical protein